MLDPIVVPLERAGLELDEFLCLLFPERSKGFLREEVRAGRVRVDGEGANPSDRLRAGQVLLFERDFDADEDVPAPLVVPELPPLRVLYEDEDLLAVDKPAGLAAEPERWAREHGSLSGALLALARARQRPGPQGERAPLDFRPRAVHRLDKDTTGVTLVAKQLESERRLRDAFEHGAVRKTYLALVEGELDLVDGAERLIDLPIAPDARRSGRMRVGGEGEKPASTRVAVEQRFRGYTLVRCHPLTGRTHQIRVHLAEIGFPLAVDPLYGRRKELGLSELKTRYKHKPGQTERPLIARHSLHAFAVEFEHRGAALRIEAPLPDDFARVLKQLHKHRPPRAASHAPERDA